MMLSTGERQGCAHGKALPFDDRIVSLNSKKLFLKHMSNGITELSSRRHHPPQKRIKRSFNADKAPGIGILV